MQASFPRPLLTFFVVFVLYPQAHAATPPALQLTLPPAVYAVPGVPLSIYYDNLVLTEHPEQYHFDIKCDVGTPEARRWTLTAAETEVGDHPMEVAVIDSDGKLLEQAKTVLRIVPKNAGADRHLRLLILGDSLTAATAYPNEIGRLLSEPGNPPWTMLGTHKPASVKPGVAHEGYGGWTWAVFLSKYEPKPERTPDGKSWKKRSSPFIYLGADGKPQIDIARYLKEECANQPPDVITILLGINDCFHANPDDAAAVGKTIETSLDNADKLLAAFHAAAPQTVFAVGLTTPPNSRESGFEANYHGKYHRWGWKRIQHRLVQRMLERFGNRQSDLIYLVPTELNLDPVSGYPLNNGVHPNDIGYAQIGASFYVWLKAWMAGRL